MHTTALQPRRPSTGRLLSLLAGALLFATAARAQDDGSTRWSNGFHVQSADGQLELKLGGRVQADYTFVSADDVFGDLEDGFEFRRARLFVSGVVYDRVELKAQYDFAGGEASAKDLYVGLLNGWGTVRFGHYKEYFSLEEQTSSKHVTFLERSLPVEAFSPSRNSGVGVHGSSGDRLNWGVGAFYDADDFGESVNEGDTNVTGRVAFRPVFSEDGSRIVHVGIAASRQDRDGTLRFRTRPEAHLSSRLVDTGTFEGGSTTLLGGEVASVFGPFWFASEYMQADTDAPSVGDPTFSGAYAQAGWFLTGESRGFKASSGAFDRTEPATNFGQGRGAWEIALRYSTIDLTAAGVAGGEQSDVTAALNWYLNPVARLMVNYVRADVDDVGEADFFLVRWAIDF